MKQFVLILKTGFVAFVLIFLNLILLTSIAFPADKIKGMPESIQIGSGTVGGGFYVQASLIASVLEKKLKIPVSAQPTSGSRENVRLLDTKKINLALIAANNGYPAYTGTGGYDKKYDILAPIVYLYPNVCFFIALESSGIRSLKDLQGKRVGWPSRTWDKTIIIPWFEAHGMDTKKDIKVVYSGFGNLHSQLRDGSLDACVTCLNAGKYPIPATSELMSRKKLTFITFEKSGQQTINDTLPYMQAADVEKGQFDQKQKVLSVDIGGPQLYARRDMSEEAVYTIASMIHKSLNQLAERNKIFTYALQNQSALVRNIGVPFHPGAVKYWKEAGLWKN
jgi:TRAP transporter TAXI family solute receptor